MASTNRVPIYLEVAPATKDKIADVARALGQSKARTLDEVLENLVLDAEGRPTFHDPKTPLATDHPELDLTYQQSA